ncbi:hypothetical protein ACTAQJ_04045 [Arthrobacter sp. alpha11c]
MISLRQDSQGFIRMSRHFPASASVSITFTDGTQKVFPGQRLNEIFDDALAAFRAGNNLDAKGFDRGPKKKVQQGIDFVPISPDMA